jgi:hypothetical protein
MTAANDDSMALHDLADDEAREIAGGDDTADRAPIYDANGNVIGGCIPQPGTREPFQF